MSERVDTLPKEGGSSLGGVVDGTTDGGKKVSMTETSHDFTSWTHPSHHTHNSYNSHQHQLYQHIIIIMSTNSSSTMASPTTGTSTFSSLFSYSSSSSTKTPHAPSNNKQLGIKAVDGTAKSNNEELKSFCAQWMML